MQNLASFIEYTDGNKPYTHTFMRMQMDNGKIEELICSQMPEERNIKHAWTIV